MFSRVLIIVVLSGSFLSCATFFDDLFGPPSTPTPTQKPIPSTQNDSITRDNPVNKIVEEAPFSPKLLQPEPIVDFVSAKLHLPLPPSLENFDVGEEIIKNAEFSDPGSSSDSSDPLETAKDSTEVVTADPGTIAVEGSDADYANEIDQLGFSILILDSPPQSSVGDLGLSYQLAWLLPEPTVPKPPVPPMVGTASLELGSSEAVGPGVDNGTAARELFPLQTDQSDRAGAAADLASLQNPEPGSPSETFERIDGVEADRVEQISEVTSGEVNRSHGAESPSQTEELKVSQSVVTPAESQTEERNQSATPDQSAERIAAVPTSTAASVKPSVPVEPVSVGERAGPVEMPRLIFARPGDQVSVVLMGQSWLFVGMSPQTPGLRFIRREVDDQATSFIFSASDLGAWSALFQEQDNSSGAVREERIAFEILGGDEFVQAVSGSQSDPVSQTSSPLLGVGPEDALYAVAERMIEEGRTSDGLAEYLRTYREGDPTINERIARIAASQGMNDLASTFWEKNLFSSDSGFAEAAGVEIVNIARETEDYGLLVTYADSVIEVLGKTIRADMIEIAEYLSEQGLTADSARIYDSLLGNFPIHRENDRILFALGQLYESKSDIQDERIAADAYRKLIDEHPASLYWEEARERLRFLERFFLQVR